MMKKDTDLEENPLEVNVVEVDSPRGCPRALESASVCMIATVTLEPDTGGNSVLDRGSLKAASAEAHLAEPQLAPSAMLVTSLARLPFPIALEE